MAESIIKQKSYNFALQIIKLCVQLRNAKHFEMSSQLLRSGTSIGANVEEAQSAQSRRDFLSKISIACKEARETHYWLRLMSASCESLTSQMSGIIEEGNEIVSILTSIIKSTKESSNAV